MSSALAKLAGSLAERRTPDGGFAAAAGGPPDSESTALATLARLALDADAARESLPWLAARQRGDGAWPLTDAVPEPSWASAWVLLALSVAGADPGALVRGRDWLVEREGVRPSWLSRTVGALTGQRSRIGHDLSLTGWPWHAAAASWVEPTATALLALRRLVRDLDVSRAAERIAAGERLLWNRMCVGGGWNYGNPQVLGQTLPPYPDTTAIALMGLQGSGHAAGLESSFEALTRLLDERASSLALALGALAFELHDRPAHPLRARLEARIDEAGPPRETRSVAFALLALGGGGALLRAPA